MTRRSIRASWTNAADGSALTAGQWGNGTGGVTRTTVSGNLRFGVSQNTGGVLWLPTRTTGGDGTLRGEFTYSANAVFEPQLACTNGTVPFNGFYNGVGVKIQSASTTLEDTTATQATIATGTGVAASTRTAFEFTKQGNVFTVWLWTANGPRATRPNVTGVYRPLTGANCYVALMATSSNSSFPTIDVHFLEWSPAV